MIGVFTRCRVTSGKVVSEEDWKKRFVDAVHLVGCPLLVNEAGHPTSVQFVCQPHKPRSASSRDFSKARALFSVSWYSFSGTESATIPAPACT